MAIVSVALDVGGTNVDGAIVNQAGEILPIKQSISSPNESDAATIVTSIGELISSLKSKAEAQGDTVAGCGIGMPGPFDYAAGVSQMTHKFQAIHGLDFGAALSRQTGLTVVFVNDAAAYGLGVAATSGRDAKKLLAVTLGTGLGCAFVENGKVIDSGPHVPKDGAIWDLPFRDGILEDYVSRRAIEREYLKGEERSLSVVGIADLARFGNASAIRAFEAFGIALGEGLALATERFQPEQIFLSGKIARAFDLFGGQMREAYARTATAPAPVEPAKDGLAFVGAARQIFLPPVVTVPARPSVERNLL
jgi:glucokinase